MLGLDGSSSRKYKRGRVAWDAELEAFEGEKV